MKPATGPSNIFVGRQQEMADLRTALEGALIGLGRVIILVGEPRSGKTRTAQELAAEAQSLGAHGRDHIPQVTLQIFLNVVEFGLDPQEAVEAACFYSYNFPSSGFPSANRPGGVRTEGRISQEAVDALHRRGHTVEQYPDSWEGSGLYGVITRNPDTGVLQSDADPRCEACAVGY